MRSHIRPAILTSQPIGHYDSAGPNQVECNIPHARPGQIIMSGALWKQIVAVNVGAVVNAAAIKPVNDDRSLRVKDEVWAGP